MDEQKDYGRDKEKRTVEGKRRANNDKRTTTVRWMVTIRLP